MTQSTLAREKLNLIAAALWYSVEYSQQANSLNFED